ncbi:hypothetical protein FQZ97_1254170 [compost metagenome]
MAPMIAPLTVTFQPPPNISTIAAGSETKAAKVGCQLVAVTVQPQSRLLSSSPSNELVTSHGHNPLPYEMAKPCQDFPVRFAQ